MSSSERQWACHSLLHLMEDGESREKLVRGEAVRKVAPLLMDQDLPVREAAASLLRFAKYNGMDTIITQLGCFKGWPY